MTYMNSTEVKRLLKKSKNIFLFKLQISETSKRPSPSDVENLGRICINNSIVIILMTKDGKNFFLYWKSKKIKYFLIFKIYSGSSFMNDLKLFEFLGGFLAESLKLGHLGLQSRVSTHPRLNTFELHLLADHRQYNLLLIAAEQGDPYIVKLMLNCNCSTESGGTNAQILTWNGRHFEVLLILLKSNLTYPDSFNVDECPNDIKEFYEISQKLNEAMTLKNEQFVLNILSQNTEMRHFYNSNNESAVAYALKYRLFDMYSLLISKNILLGPHEKFSEIKNELKESDREKLREIHYNQSKFLPDNHMHVLLSNSRLGHNTSDANLKYLTIQKAFELLNRNKFIQIILIIVAASRNFRIIFDFNRDSVEVVDPTANESTRGEFYPTGRIYIGAKNLLNHEQKYKSLGTLAHELCHYAMSLVYENNAKPYTVEDIKSERQFDEVLKVCKAKLGKEKIIDLVHNYSIFMHHAELVVRVPHLIMKYFENPEKFQAVREIFIKLFKIFEDKIFLEMKHALPRIERNAEIEAEKNKRKIRRMRIISIVIGLISIIAILCGVLVTRYILYKPVYTFSTLSNEERLKVENAPIIYKNISIEFHDLFPSNCSAYYKLTSDHISKMLSEYPLNFNDPHLIYLDELVVLSWTNLTLKLKDRFLNSKYNFQNATLELKDLYNSSSSTFKYLTSNQIINVLDNEILTIHRIIQNTTIFYRGRYLFDEQIHEIYFWYIYTRTIPNYDNNCMYEKTPNTFEVKFEKFYENFTNMNFDIQTKMIHDIRDNRRFKLCSAFQLKIVDPRSNKEVDSLLRYKKFKINIGGTLREAFKNKIFILSAESGSGKTILLQQYTLLIKLKFPKRWITYLDCRDYVDLLQNFTSTEKLHEIVHKILGLSSKNEFEKEIFEDNFKSGNIIFLWDSFDQIPAVNRKIVEKIIIFIYNTTNNIQFISTRSLYSDWLRSTFRTKAFTLFPFFNYRKTVYLYEFFLSLNVSKSDVKQYVNKVKKIIDSAQEKSDFNTPLLLGMIADVIFTYPDIFESENLYEIYEKFVDKKILIWLQTSKFATEIIKTIVATGFNMKEYFQRDALRSDYYKVGSFLTLKLKIRHQNAPKELTIDEISRMGILYPDENDNYGLGHRTFCDFFIAQYLIEKVYNADDGPTEQEAELRIELFQKYSTWRGVKKFMSSYVLKEKYKTKKFDPVILKLFRKKFKNILSYSLHQVYEPFPFFFYFFRKDMKLLTEQMHLKGENESFLAKTYDFVTISEINIFMVKRDSVIKYAKKKLSSEQFADFTDLKDKKGLFMYSSYYYKRISKSMFNVKNNYKEYCLNEEILNSNDSYFVLESIVNSTTNNETKVLLGSKLVLYPIQEETPSHENLIIIENSLDYYEKLWILVDEYLSPDEQKAWLSKSFDFIFSLKNEITRNFLIGKLERLFTDDQIFNIFYNNKILHLIAASSNNDTQFQKFNCAWNFFASHTVLEQKMFYLTYIADVDCYMNEFYTRFCYLVPRLNLLQASLLGEIGINVFKGLSSYHDVLNIYNKYFNTTELQEIITSGSKDFIPYLILLRPLEICTAYAQLLKETFKSKMTRLRDFFEEQVEPTTKNIFELLNGYDDPNNCTILFKNLVNITDSQIIDIN
ncbi:hypothetical protein ACKWTF_003418 [Chironomus riparius]